MPVLRQLLPLSNVTNDHVNVRSRTDRVQVLVQVLRKGLPASNVTNVNITHWPDPVEVQLQLLRKGLPAMLPMLRSRTALTGCWCRCYARAYQRGI